MNQQVTMTKVSYNPFCSVPILIPTPTTESQREIWATLQMDPDSTLCYNEALEISLRGQVDSRKLDAAFQEVLKRHDALRAFFSPDGKKIFVMQSTQQHIQQEDYSSMPEKESLLAALKQRLVTHKFDLTTGPCITATLVKMTEEVHVLLLAAHHLVCDGWSFSVIISELGLVYSSLLTGEHPVLPSANQFIDHALGESLHGHDQDHKNFWVKQFQSGRKKYIFPIDFARPSFRTYDSQYAKYEISPETVVKLKRLAASKKSSFYTVLMASFGLLMHKITGSEDLVIGMASAAQSSQGKDDLVGHMVNLLPLPIKVRPVQAFDDFLKDLKGRMLDAFEHQNFSFGSLLKELNVPRNPAEIPLLNTVFNIDQQPPGQGLTFDGITGHYSTIPRLKENFELFFNAVSCENNLIVECQYNSNLFRASTVTNWLASYDQLLKLVLASPGAMVNSFTLPDLYVPRIMTSKREVDKVRGEGDEKIEISIKEAWSRVLGLQGLKVDDNFFVLGGHSLLAVEVAALLKEKLGREVSIKDMFECPTIAKLAARLSMASVAMTSLVPIKHQSLATAPISHNQMQVWYIEELYPETRMHNLPTSLRIKWAVDPHTMERALKFMIQRHESLRTCIMTEDGEPFQKVISSDAATARFRMETISVSEDQLMSSMRREADKLFDKQSAPLFKATLFKLLDNDYSLFIMAHHAIWDGWCFDIFFEELNIIYTALLKNEEPQFKRNPNLSYIDYTLWFNENLKRGALQSQMDYWQNKLKAPLPVLELPTDHKRPLVAGHTGGIHRFNLTSAQMLNLRNYAKTHNSSIFNVMLTAFKITLASYTGQEDIIVGSPVRGRNRPDLLQTIGYFVNTVALRSTVAPDSSFEENLRTVTNCCLEAFSNQDIPFETVLNAIDYPKDLSRTAVFQSFFIFQDMTNRQFMLDGRPILQVSVTNASVKTDLDIWVRVTNSEIRGAFEYRSDLFKEETIERFCQNFFYLLDGLAQNAGKELNLLPKLHPSQKELIHKKWNATYQDPEKLRAFHQSFEEMASLYPDRVAIESDIGVLTYAELDCLSNKCARGLVQWGIRPGNLAGISLTRGPDLLIAILGTLKAGAGYVPLDPGFPQDRLDYMVNNSGLQVLISESSLAPRFAAPSKKILIKDIINSPNLHEGPLEVDVALSDTMYVIYTSGSTGNPKGVEISHLAVSNFLNSMKKSPGIEPHDKLLAVTTFSFDIAALELYLPLTTGATVYLASSYDVVDGPALKKIIEERNITMMQATPSTWRLLLSAGWKGNRHFKILCGGEPFPKDLASKLISMSGSVWNMYGPTETTIWSTCKELSLQDESVSIGRPIDNTTIYILNEKLDHVPIGGAGELCIGGLGLAKGYYGRADLTAEKFLESPFIPGKKIYATGDFARFLANGEIQYLGRRDGQVKVRGYRIELGEIEAVLARTDNIKEAAVITMEVRPGDTRIVAFIVAFNSQHQTPERHLRESLGKKLPQYMVPSHFVYLNELPKTLNGKIDKKVLPGKFSTQEVTLEVTPPVRPADDGLRGIWQEILKKDKIMDLDNFFIIGGNSLLAVQLFSRISRKYGLTLNLTTLIEHPEFGNFQEHIESKTSVSSLPVQMAALPSALTSLVSIRQGGTEDPIFCFHGVGGNVLNYIPLANAVSQSRPFLALQTRGLDGSSPLLNSIEEMAASYITEMKLIRPFGPYILAGGSMGGMVALEVAQQLVTSGEQVEKLIMFDTFGPDVDIKSYDRSERSYLKNFKISIYYRRRALMNKMVVRFLKALHFPVPIEVRLFDVEMNNYRALWKYKPRKFPGDLHLIRAKLKPRGWYSDPFMGWRNAIEGKITTIEINGNHNSFMESPELGEALMKVL